ncbi:MAG: S-layer homology domain-containing protein [Eubacteriales bacterium]
MPYYIGSDGNRIFIGFASDKSGVMKYIAPDGVMVQFTPNPKYFDDITGHWAESFIGFVTEREIFVGTGQGAFPPDMGMTRAMFATVIGRLYERSYGTIMSSSEHAFTDVDYDSYYGKYIDWASKNKINVGVGEGLFEPDRAITREEMAVILYRFAKFMGVPMEDLENVELDYTDASSISSWAVDAAKHCQVTGIILGRGNGNFVPKGKQRARKLQQFPSAL